MHPFIADLPAVQRIARRRADLTAARDKWRQRAAEIRERRDQALRSREAAAHDAILAGQEPPPPVDLDPYRIDGDEQMFRDELAKLDEAQRAAIAEAEPTLLARIKQAEAAIAERRGPAMDALFDLVEETNQMRRLRNEIDRTRPSVDARGRQIARRGLSDFTLDQWMRGADPNDEPTTVRSSGLTRY